MNLNDPYLSVGALPIYRPGSNIGCLCIHGFSAAPAEVKWLADYLHDQAGMTTYTPRLAGHGTDYTHMRRMSWREWYMSARDGYQLLRDTCDLVFVAGLSMGGLMTLLLASAGDVEIAGAAVMAAPTQFENPNVARTPYLKHVRNWVDAPDKTDLPQIVREEQERRGEPVVGRTHYDRWSVQAIAQLYELAGVVNERLSQITAPLILVYAENDESVPLESSDQIKAKVSSEVIEQRLILESRHIITQDTRRDEAFQYVQSFFERQLAHADRQ
jgi:carboxylesterase